MPFARRGGSGDAANNHTVCRYIGGDITTQTRSTNETIERSCDIGGTPYNTTLYYIVLVVCRDSAPMCAPTIVGLICRRPELMNRWRLRCHWKMKYIQQYQGRKFGQHSAVHDIHLFIFASGVWVHSSGRKYPERVAIPKETHKIPHTHTLKRLSKQSFSQSRRGLVPITDDVGEI